MAPVTLYTEIKGYPKLTCYLFAQEKKKKKAGPGSDQGAASNMLSPGAMGGNKEPNWEAVLFGHTES
jgi:hypothetical protein